MCSRSRATRMAAQSRTPNLCVLSAALLFCSCSCRSLSYEYSEFACSTASLCNILSRIIVKSASAHIHEFRSHSHSHSQTTPNNRSIALLLVAALTECVSNVDSTIDCLHVCTLWLISSFGFVRLRAVFNSTHSRVRDKTCPRPHAPTPVARLVRRYI